MEVGRHGRPVPDDELHEVVQWIIESTDEVLKELGDL